MVMISSDEEALVLVLVSCRLIPLRVQIAEVSESSLGEVLELLLQFILERYVSRDQSEYKPRRSKRLTKEDKLALPGTSFKSSQARKLMTTGRSITSKG